MLDGSTSHRRAAPCSEGRQRTPRLLNSIGPSGDGNEVWLVTPAVRCFAAFRMWYADDLSGFYLAFYLLPRFNFRAVAIEFRSKQPMRWWRQMWDVSFSGGSILAAAAHGASRWATSPGAWPIDARGSSTAPSSAC